MNWSAEYVETENGKKPFLEFLNELDFDSKLQIIAAIDEILEMRDLNLVIPESKSKHLRDGIFEMKLHHKNISTRSLYFFVKDKKMIFTHGFIKKTNKTPANEIDKAEKLRKYYLLNK